MFLNLKSKQVRLLSLVVLLGLSQRIQAETLQLGNPAYGGTGCPAGSASATLSPDNQSLSILFDQFVTEAGGDTNRDVDRKSCNIAIPVRVPQGYSVSVFQVDYRGFNYLPSGARAQFSAEYFFGGGRGPRASRNFQGPINTDYLFTNQLGVEALVWSRCGEDVTLRVNASMMTQTNRQRAQAMSTVDSTDIQSGIIYHIQWRTCR
jgi:hypothetical protein